MEKESKNLNGLLFRTQNTILSAAVILGVTSGISAILGLIKTRLLAKSFGISRELTIFYTADKIPNLMYSILILGAISTVFIPVFTGLLKKDADGAYKTASSIINFTLLFFILIGTVIFLVSPTIIKLLSVGTFSEEEILLGSNIMRIMLVSQIFLVLGSLLTSVLQSFKYFTIPALAPVFYNIGMILGIVFLSDRFGIYGAAVGILIGSVLHFSIQLPLAKKTKFKYSPIVNFSDHNFKNIFNLIPARIINVLISNVTQTINNSLAILISSSSAIYLRFADQLQTFPVNLFGVSVAAASLPTLSSQAAYEDREKFKSTFLTSFHQVAYLVLPVSAILLILRVPAIRIIYGVSNFPWASTIRTAQTLAFFSISIFPQSVVYLTARAFYALKDTKTPVIINTLTAITNVSLAIFFITKLKFGVWSIALAYTITSMIDAGLLVTFLSKKIGGFDSKKLFIPLTKILWSTALMGVMLYLPMKLLDNFILDTTRTINLLILTAIASLTGIGAYLLITRLLEVEEIELFYKLLRKLKITKKDIKDIKTEAVNLTATEQETV